MHALRRFAPPLAPLLAFGVLALSLHTPAAHAGLASTQSVLDAAHGQAERARVSSFLQRDDVRAELLARGVSPAQVQARLDALTDEEVQTLASHIDQLPAGGSLGSVLGVALIVFLVLLFTDIMGWTSVFPFTKKGSARQ